MKKYYPEFEFFSHRLEEVFGPGFTKSSEFDKILKSTSGGTENEDYGKKKKVNSAWIQSSIAKTN
jgi:hypothetical protein